MSRHHLHIAIACALTLGAAFLAVRISMESERGVAPHTRSTSSSLVPGISSTSEKLAAPEKLSTSEKLAAPEKPSTSEKLAAPEELSTATFLGLWDDESKKIGDSAPESALWNITNVSTVGVSDYAEYQRLLASGKVVAHATRDGYIYYATKPGRCVGFPNGTSAFVFVTERFKAKIPK